MIRARKPESQLLKALAGLFWNPFMESTNGYGFLRELFVLLGWEDWGESAGNVGSGGERRGRG